MRIVDRKEVGAALEAFCDKFETYKEAAKKLGITLSQLSAARNKPKSVVPAKALKKLGFEFKAVYLAKDLPPTRLQKVVKSLSKKPPTPKKAKVMMAEAVREMHVTNGRTPLQVAKPRVRKPSRPHAALILPTVEAVQPLVEIVEPVEESENRDLPADDPAMVDLRPPTPVFVPSVDDDDSEAEFDENGYPIYR